MALQGNSVAQQDALSNAFLALFGILVLILIQIGFEHIDARAQERAYAQPPKAIDALDGGWTAAVAWAPRPTVITILTPSPGLRVVPDSPPATSVAENPVPLTVEDHQGWSSSRPVRLYQIFPSQAITGAVGSATRRSDRTLRLENRLKETSAEVEVWLDDGRVGEPGKPLKIEAGAPLTIRLCADGSARAFWGDGGRCE